MDWNEWMDRCNRVDGCHRMDRYERLDGCYRVDGSNGFDWANWTTCHRLYRNRFLWTWYRVFSDHDPCDYDL